MKASTAGYPAPRWDCGGLSRSIWDIHWPVGYEDNAVLFQFRSFRYEALGAAGVTIPPWPGKGEAAVVESKWPAAMPHQQGYW